MRVIKIVSGDHESCGFYFHTEEQLNSYVKSLRKSTRVRIYESADMENGKLPNYCEDHTSFHARVVGDPIFEGRV